MASEPAPGSPFDGYARRATPAPDPELTQVGPGTPGGEYLRRFWQPVAFARDLATDRRAACASWARTSWSSAIAAGGSACSTCTARIAATSLEFGIPARARHALLLPRLGLRRGRALPRDAGRARGQPPVRARLAGRVSDARVLRASSSRIWARPTGAPRSRSTTPSRCRAISSMPAAEVHAAVQLAPGEGQQHGPGAHRVPARALSGYQFTAGLRRGARARLAARRRGHGLHRDPPRAAISSGCASATSCRRTCTSSRARSRRRHAAQGRRAGR